MPMLFLPIDLNRGSLPPEQNPEPIDLDIFCDVALTPEEVAKVARIKKIGWLINLIALSVFGTALELDEVRSRRQNVASGHAEADIVEVNVSKNSFMLRFSKAHPHSRQEIDQVLKRALLSRKVGNDDFVRLSFLNGENQWSTPHIYRRDYLSPWDTTIAVDVEILR